MCFYEADVEKKKQILVLMLSKQTQQDSKYNVHSTFCIDEHSRAVALNDETSKW